MRTITCAHLIAAPDQPIAAVRRIGIDGGAERRFCGGGIAANAMDQSEIVMAAGMAGRRAQNAAIKCLCIIEFAAAMGQNGLLPQRFDAAARTEPSRRCPMPLSPFFLHGPYLATTGWAVRRQKTKLWHRSMGLTCTHTGVMS